MRRRHPVPRVWLMTDPRMGDALFDALGRLPRGSGVVFRHYGVANRAVVFERVRRIARARGLTLIAAGGAMRGADGVHNARGRGLTSRAVHSRRDMIAAARDGVDVAFVSPVFATRSHPGARPLGATGLSRIVRNVSIPVIALGGMDARRYRTLAPLGIHGWAAIDAWMAPNQKRKAVPT